MYASGKKFALATKETCQRNKVSGDPDTFPAVDGKGEDRATNLSSARDVIG
jgi:hypothetical protein